MRSRFFIGMACACLLIAFTGFAQSFFLRPLFDAGPDMPLEYVHGAVMTAWLVIFFIQAFLVATHRTAIHRRIGVAGAVVGVCVLVVGTLLTLVIPGWLTTQGLDFSVEENLARYVEPIVERNVFGFTSSAEFYSQAIREKVERYLELLNLVESL